MRINESFISVQGEGPQSGQRVLFIRLAGCNLKCSFCDSKYASLGMEVNPSSLKKLIRSAADMGIRNVVWTGGEPLLQKFDLIELVEQTAGFVSHSIETNGTQELSPEECELFEWVVVSPKDNEFHSPTKEEFYQAVEYWTKQPNVIIKPVISTSNGDTWFQWCADQEGAIQERVYFMPRTPDAEGNTRSEILEGHDYNVAFIVRMMNSYKLAAHVSPRLHVVYGVR